MTSTKDVIERIAYHIGVSASQLDANCPVMEITPDSFALVELALGLQDDFGIDLHQEDLESDTTIQNLSELIISRAQVVA